MKPLICKRITYWKCSLGKSILEQEEHHSYCFYLVVLCLAQPHFDPSHLVSNPELLITKIYLTLFHGVRRSSNTKQFAKDVESWNRGEE